jgi:Domain of unknown function (DUF4279)
MEPKSSIGRAVEAASPDDFACSATLRIFGDLPDLDEISSELGLAPTHTHKKGDSYHPMAPYAHDMWTYAPPVHKSEPLHKHIDALWAMLKPHRRYLLKLKHSATIDVYLDWWLASDASGVEMPPKSLEMFSDLEIPFELAVKVT